MRSPTIKELGERFLKEHVALHCNTPAFKYKLGLITATIWKNNDFYSVDFARSYKDGEGNWQSTTSYSHSDLLNVSKCAERAENWIARQSNDSK